MVSYWIQAEFLSKNHCLGTLDPNEGSLNDLQLNLDILGSTKWLPHTLWSFNIAMENGPFIDDFHDFPSNSMVILQFATLNNKRVYLTIGNPPTLLTDHQCDWNQQSHEWLFRGRWRWQVVSWIQKILQIPEEFDQSHLISWYLYWPSYSILM